MTKAHELKPCPFCGGEACLDEQIPAFCGAKVVCLDCDAQGASHKVTGDAEAGSLSAVAAWNTRA